MTGERKKLLLWITAGVLSHALLFVGGYYFASKRMEAEQSDHAIADFIDGLAALAYLEKSDAEGARYILRVSLDGHLLAIQRLGSEQFDAARPGARKKLVLQYDKIRGRYPPIDYADGGTMNRKVDSVINAAKEP
jgi:hypothetical protein